MACPSSPPEGIIRLEPDESVTLQIIAAPEDAQGPLRVSAGCSTQLQPLRSVIDAASICCQDIEYRNHSGFQVSLYKRCDGSVTVIARMHQERVKILPLVYDMLSVRNSIAIIALESDAKT